MTKCKPSIVRVHRYSTETVQEITGDLRGMVNALYHEVSSLRVIPQARDDLRQVQCAVLAIRLLVNALDHARLLDRVLT